MVDDEPLARRTLCALLEWECEVEPLGECGDCPSATEAVHRRHPDILFLDVQMPELDGFGVLRAILDMDVPAVVFVTAFGEHAVRAFDEEATDTLVKPFDDERFGRALDRASRSAISRRASTRAASPGFIARPSSTSVA